MDLDDGLDRLEGRLQAIEKRTATQVCAPTFWPRAWAIFGHNFTVWLIIAVVIYGLAALIVLSQQ